MADAKKDKAAAKDKTKAVKELSKKECKSTRGGMSSLVNGGLAGPEDFRLR